MCPKSPKWIVNSDELLQAVGDVHRSREADLPALRTRNDKLILRNEPRLKNEKKVKTSCLAASRTFAWLATSIWPVPLMHEDIRNQANVNPSSSDEMEL